MYISSTKELSSFTPKEKNIWSCVIKYVTFSGENSKHQEKVVSLKLRQ